MNIVKFLCSHVNKANATHDCFMTAKLYCCYALSSLRSLCSLALRVQDIAINTETRHSRTPSVIPAKAGIFQFYTQQIPVFTGMTRILTMILLMLLFFTPAHAEILRVVTINDGQEQTHDLPFTPEYARSYYNLDRLDISVFSPEIKDKINIFADDKGMIKKDMIPIAHYAITRLNNLEKDSIKSIAVYHDDSTLKYDILKQNTLYDLPRAGFFQPSDSSAIADNIHHALSMARIKQQQLSANDNIDDNINKQINDSLNKSFDEIQQFDDIIQEVNEPDPTTTNPAVPSNNGGILGSGEDD